MFFFITEESPLVLPTGKKVFKMTIRPFIYVFGAKLKVLLEK
jgi:hypothetical protein